jgi:hypothetical protein
MVENSNITSKSWPGQKTEHVRVQLTTAACIISSLLWKIEFFPKHLLEACIVTRAVALSGAFLVFFLY